MCEAKFIVKHETKITFIANFLCSLLVNDTLRYKPQFEYKVITLIL